jgi:hypothetical protein
LFFYCLNTDASSEINNFPELNERKELAEALLDGIEVLDAMSIEIRNKTRTVDWDNYKKSMISRFVQANNWEDLFLTIRSLHFGIINRHSYVFSGNIIKGKHKNIPRWPSFDLIYTWPEVAFFGEKLGSEISELNGIEIDLLFDDYFNYYCNDAHISGCLFKFKEELRRGYSFDKNLSELHVSYVDNKLTVRKKGSSKDESEATKPCTKYTTLDLLLIYEGQDTCLFEAGDAYVLKIHSFGKWGTESEDIYCEQAKEEGMCRDIISVRNILNKSFPKQTNLVIDIQGNRGGTEITPWIAALTHHGFKDNLVQYKNIKELSESKIRSDAFYGSPAAESWYQVVKDDVKESDVFFPARSDFCRGEENCVPSIIKSTSKPIRFKSLNIVTDNNCVSSCDDLVWRLKKFSGAKVYGQPPSTDGTFISLEGNVFKDDNKGLMFVVVGKDYASKKVSGPTYAVFSLPIARTVDSDGRLLDGDESVLDHIFPITLENFQHLASENIARILSLVKSD